MLPVFVCFCLFEFLGQVEIVPADDGVFDEAVAALGNFLLLLFGLGIFPWIADSYGSCELVCQFDFVELLFDSLSQFKFIKITQNEGSFYIKVPNAT